MKRGFLLSNKSSGLSPRTDPTKSSATSPAKSTGTSPPGWHSSASDSPSTLHWTFLPSNASRQSPTASTACLVTKQTRSVLSQCRPSAPASFAPKACDVRLIPGKGLGVIATRDLAPNALVFVDSPLLIYEASDRGMKRSQADAILRHAISHLRPELQERFNALSNAFAGAESTLGRVETNGAPVISFEGAGLDADAVTYTGVFPLYSRLNHACDANARPEWDWKRLQLGVRTNRAVKAGEELCVSYIVPQQKRRERQEELMVKYRFLCQCTWCSLSDEDSAKMDIERERQAAAFLKQWHAQNAER